MNIKEKIIEIIRSEMDTLLDPDVEITPDMNLTSDLHVDSLDMVLIVDRIEEAFGNNKKTEDMSGIRTVNDIEKKILELQKEQA